MQKLNQEALHRVVKREQSVMADISLTCPYCGTQMAGFRGSYFMANARQLNTSYSVMLQCGVCGECIVARFSSISYSELQEWLAGRSSAYLLEPNDVQPKQVSLEAPQYTPNNVRSYFLQGLNNLRRQNFDAAGTMFRKSLETGLKHLNADGKGTLHKRIDNLPNDLGITPAMKAWAHEIRELGNDAAHDDEPFTAAEAKSLHSFTEMFLTYAFTLPGMLAERKLAEPPV